MYCATQFIETKTKLVYLIFSSELQQITFSFFNQLSAANKKRDHNIFVNKTKNKNCL